jgi:purine operon repressor
MDMFGAAKSTISEDIGAVQNLLGKLDYGNIETIQGASGGVRFIPYLSPENRETIIDGLCSELSNKERILPGGFMYMLDVIYNPARVADIGKVFASEFYKLDIDCVITVETKGIPLAFRTAAFLNVPLVIASHYSEVSDGASVNTNFISGSSSRMQTMVLPTKALKRNSRLLFIDDFMKGGGTAKGIIELAKEFNCEVVGFGVLVATQEPEKKLVDNWFSLIELKGVNPEEESIEIRPGRYR